jgi:uncharacterized protein YuzE
MKLHVDHKADALYLRLDDAKIVESEEIAPGVVVDFDGKNRVVGVEVLAISKREPKSRPRKYPTPDTSMALALREKPAKKYGG